MACAKVRTICLRSCSTPLRGRKIFCSAPPPPFSCGPRTFGISYILLHQGAPHVLGTGATEWARSDDCVDYLSGARPWPRDSTSRWDLMKNPLPASGEDAIFRDIRAGAGLVDREMRGPRFENLDRDLARDFDRDFERLAIEHNPLIRRIVRRTRPMLEERGLLKRIHVEVHPTAADRLPERLFTGEGLAMGVAFTEAYQAAEVFCRLYAQTRPAAGFLKTILLRRIGSSPAAGLATARHLLRGNSTDVLEAEQSDIEAEPEAGLSGLSSGERLLLERVIVNLEAVSEMPDPKIEVAIAYLRDRGWLTSHGAILFSQYLTTAEWTAAALAAAFPDEPVGVYAGGAASFVLRGSDRRGARREDIKAAIQRGELRLLAATDAACEGLNLQSLGAQFNMDLPWNPSRLEQRKGRVQRIGQARDIVHVVNMRYAGTVEDDVYAALSDRMGDIFAVIGQLPDGFEDDWVGAVLRDRAAVRNFPA
jgi:hypothetical protein